MPPEDEQNQQPPEGGDDHGALPQVRAALDRETERRKQVEAQLADAQAAQREVAFLRAGVDLESRSGQLVAKAYDGELDPEAIKAFATEIPGAMRDASPPPAPTESGGGEGPTAQERRQAQIEAELSGEGSPPGQAPEKPLGIDMMDAAFKTQGGNRVRPGRGMSDRATAAGLQVLLNRAVADDPEAVFKRADETWADATERWRRSQA